jgi:hypothetical protein
MKLVDLKRTKAEVKAEAKEWSGASIGGQPEYPWGLQLRLEREELEKLGIADTLPPVGAKLTLTVTAEVTSVSENRMADGRNECCVTLQVQQMGMGADQPKAEGKRTAALTSKYGA